MKGNKLNLLWLGLAALVLVSISCATLFQTTRDQPEERESQKESRVASPEARGERIYFTATNEAGEAIPYRGGPNFGGMMMGTYLTCAACHGPEARGGTHWMHMEVMDAPDIRFEALMGEAGEHSGDEQPDEHTEYTLEDFRLAVIEGKHPDGEPLSQDMPRWDMSEEDLADLFAFLKSIP